MFWNWGWAINGSCGVPMSCVSRGLKGIRYQIRSSLKGGYIVTPRVKAIVSLLVFTYDWYVVIQPARKELKILSSCKHSKNVVDQVVAHPPERAYWNVFCEILHESRGRRKKEFQQRRCSPTRVMVPPLLVLFLSFFFLFPLSLTSRAPSPCSTVSS